MHSVPAMRPNNASNICRIFTATVCCLHTAIRSTIMFCRSVKSLPVNWVSVVQEADL